MLYSLSIREGAEETKWRNWTERESSKRFALLPAQRSVLTQCSRIFYGMIILSHMLSTAYGLCPAFSITQVARLEMPGDQDLWDAPSEEQWLLLRRDRPQFTSLSLGEAVAKLMYDKTTKETPEASWNWSPFATCVAMHAVAMQIWQMSPARGLGIPHADNGLQYLPPGLSDMGQTEAALNRCRQLLISATRGGEATWSDEDGPMLFNCVAVLRVAYCRTCMPAATLDSFILLRECRSEISDAIKKYLCVDQPRGESITRAVARSLEGLFVPIQAGVLWTIKTAALTWWVDHAFAGWDTGA